RQAVRSGDEPIQRQVVRGRLPYVGPHAVAQPCERLPKVLRLRRLRDDFLTGCAVQSRFHQRAHSTKGELHRQAASAPTPLRWYEPRQLTTACRPTTARTWSPRG